MLRTHLFLASLTACLAATAGAPRPVHAQAPELDGYLAYDAFVERIKRLEAPDVARVVSIAKTAGGRDVWAIEIGAGDLARKPAIVIVGGVHGPHLVGGELAVRMAERAVAALKADDTKELLARHAIYVIPRPSPDATEKSFAKPTRELAGNARATDDDRDGKFGEDPPEDLDGDGWIVQMRVEDVAGKWIPHPDDPRVMIEADSTRGERGRFRLLTEGVDNDGDEQFNEDAGDGVEFNRAFPFRHEPFQPGTSTHAATEVEVRAVIDWLQDRPNIAAVYTLSPTDNLNTPWKPDGGKEGQLIKTTIFGDDARHVDKLAEIFRERLGLKDCPQRSPAGGDFAEWAYFHYGRWSLASRGWWIPKVPPPEVKPVEGAPPPKPDDRAPEDREALRWFARENVAGFVEWHKVDHPNFPGKLVEVGGFKPLLRTNPPAKQLDELADKHHAFTLDLLKSLPTATIADVRVEPLGGGLVRLKCVAKNDGRLPTMSAMGETNREAWPLWIELELPADAKLLTGKRKTKIARIGGLSTSPTMEWLIKWPAGAVNIRLRSPTTGESTTVVEPPRQP